MYEVVKRIYLEGKIDINGLAKAVNLKWITEDQYNEIKALRGDIVG